MTARSSSTLTRQQRRRRTALARDEARSDHPASLFAAGRNRTLILAILLAVGTLALYSPAIGHPFIFNYDDDSYVINNAHVQAGLSWQTFTWALTATDYSNWHPLTWLSHALDCQLYGLEPGGHHLTSVAFHALNAALLFLLLAWATGLVGRSFLVAALFTVHPLNVQSVAWVAERKSVLSTFFFLLTLGAYGWYARKPNFRRYLSVAVCFALALAAKPMVITLPCVLFLLDFWPLRRLASARRPVPSGDHRETTASVSPSTLPQSSLTRLILEKLPLFALSAASGIITVIASRSYGSMRLALSLGARVENAIYSYAIYLWKSVWPSRLAVFYPHPGNSLTYLQVGAAAAFLAACTAVAWWQRSSRPHILTGWLWFLGTLVPAIGLIQVGEQGMADRYAYIPLIGIFLIVVWTAAEFSGLRHFTFAASALASGLVLAILCLVTWRQLACWQSAYDLWSQAVAVTRNNSMAEENLGAALLALDRAQEAIPHFQNAIRIRPAEASFHLNLAGAFAMTSQNRDAIREYEYALPRLNDPNTEVSAYQTLARLYAGTGNYAAARASYQHALLIDPGQSSAQEGLAEVEFSDALRNVAESPSGAAYLRLGQLLEQQNRQDQARTAYQQALRFDPKLEAARKALAGLKDEDKSAGSR